MPYKLSADGQAVMVKKGGKWRVKKRYRGPRAKERALAYLQALLANVKH